MRIRILLLALLLAAAGRTQPHPFQVGERLEYAAHFNLLPVGDASLAVVTLDTFNSLTTYQVSFRAQTGTVADRIYRIRDRVDIWMDRSQLFTHKVIKNIREGNYHKDVHTVIDYRKSIAVTNRDTVAVSEGLRDPYSLFYYLRTVPLVIGDTLDLNTFDNNKQTGFRLKVTSKDIINVEAGTFFCLVVKPFREQRTLFKNQGDMEIWLSDDKHRIPVQILIKLKYGSMLLQLKKYHL